MGFRRINPVALGVNRGAFSHTIGIDAAALRNATIVMVSGQVALDRQGRLVGKDDIAAQCHQVFSNLSHAVAASGGTLESVVQLRTYLTHAEDISGFVEARRRLYKEMLPGGQYPTNTLLIVAGLADPDYRVEIEAIAVVQVERVGAENDLGSSAPRRG